MNIVGEVVQAPFEVDDYIGLAFLQGVEDGHRSPPRARASIGLRTEADLAGHHRRA